MSQSLGVQEPPGNRRSGSIGPNGCLSDNYTICAMGMGYYYSSHGPREWDRWEIAQFPQLPTSRFSTDFEMGHGSQ